MRLTKRATNVAKLLNLKNALEDCGIQAKLENIDGYITVTCEIWNAVNGYEEPVSFYLEWDNTIVSCVEPKTDMEEVVKILESWL